MTVHSPEQGRVDYLRIGKDHFTLADWRISVAKYQKRKKQDGSNVDFAEFVIDRNQKNAQRVTLESPSTIGLPTAGDEDFLIALLAIAKTENFTTDIVRFVPSQLLKIMGLATTKKNYVRLKSALKRLLAVTVTYEHTWYSRAKNTTEPVLITGILAEAKIVFQRGRRPANAPDSYVQWTRNFHTSLREGNLTNLDLDLYFGWKRPGAKHLYRHLNKVWHAGRKPKTYERDLKEIACGHLGMTVCKDLKRNFHAIISEMEERSYLAALDQKVRYRKVRPGVWRVRLELHPCQLHSTAKGVGESPKFKNFSAADTLVRAYHKHRFGRDEYQPKPHECKHARTLLKENDIKVLQKLVPIVADAVARSYHDQDCHFGAGVPFFEKALQERLHRKQTSPRQKKDQANESVSETVAIEEQRRRQEIRTNRLAAWKSLPTKKQQTYFSSAIANTKSETQRTRLRRKQDLNNPPTEVLSIMAADQPNQC